MYGRCDALHHTREMFDVLCHRGIQDLVSWNSTVSAYICAFDPNVALMLFDKMTRCISPVVSLVNILSVCASVGASLLGKHGYDFAVITGLEDKVFLGNVVIDMYVKCGQMYEAKEVFDRMKLKDVVSWNALVTWYSQTSRFELTLPLFDKMREENINLDEDDDLMVRSVWKVDGIRCFYKGIIIGIIGSLATGATYFGIIESTKKWIEDSHPSLRGHWAHFIAGAVGDTLGSFVYVPCEVIKQRMQVQGTITSWSSVAMKDGIMIKPGEQIYGYYTGMFHAGCSIWKTQGLNGLYAGYLSTLARDVPFAGLMVMFYEGLKDVTEYGKQRWTSSPNWHVNNSFEGLVLGGLAGGLSAYITTPLDVVKTRLQVQGSTLRYSGWLDANCNIWAREGMKGMFRGSIPRITWYIPASALTFMAVEFLRDHFNERVSNGARLSVDKKKSLQEVA